MDFLDDSNSIESGDDSTSSNFSSDDSDGDHPGKQTNGHVLTALSLFVSFNSLWSDQILIAIGAWMCIRATMWPLHTEAG